MAAISVVIPALDDAPMLRECLAALARQSRPADEIIVVDDGSVDDTVSVAIESGADVVSSLEKGIPGATATGFDEAVGDILARLDADSVPPADWLERIEIAMSDPGCTAITGPGEFYGGSDLQRWLGRRVYLSGYFRFVGRLLGHPPLFGSNYAIRRSAWVRVHDAVHRHRQDVHDDLDLSYQLTPDMRVRFDPTLVVGISARPFESADALGRRLHWAWTTIALNERDPSYRARRSSRRVSRPNRAQSGSLRR